MLAKFRILQKVVLDFTRVQNSFSTQLEKIDMVRDADHIASFDDIFLYPIVTDDIFFRR